jgi:hypothetical protein
MEDVGGISPKLNISFLSYKTQIPHNIHPPKNNGYTHQRNCKWQPYQISKISSSNYNLPKAKITIRRI